jgi:hypothetical protein
VRAYPCALEFQRLHQCLVVCVLSKLSEQLDLEIENSGAIVTHSIYLIINLDSYIKLQTRHPFMVISYHIL